MQSQLGLRQVWQLAGVDAAVVGGGRGQVEEAAHRAVAHVRFDAGKKRR